MEIDDDTMRFNHDDGTILPASRQRLTEAVLTASGSIVMRKHQKIYDTIMLELKKSKSEMLNWMMKRGVLVDPASTYDGVTLQQFILFWHMAEIDPDLLILIQTYQPLLSLHRKGNGTRAEMTDCMVVGKAAFYLVQEGHIRPVLVFDRLPRFLKPPGLTIESVTTQNLTENFLNIDKTYDAAWATVVKRWDLADVVSAEDESTGPVNLYATFVFAHELTHVEQFLYEPLYPHVRKLVEARTRFRLWTGEVNTPIFRLNQDPVHDSLSTRGFRSLEGDDPITRLLDGDERWEYIGEKKALPSAMNQQLDQRLSQCFQICQICGLDTENGVSPKAFFQKMKSDISAVAKALDNNESSMSPITDVNWINRLQELKRYLFSGDGDGSRIASAAEAIPGCDYDINQSLTKAVIDIILADEVRFNPDERKKVVDQITTITALGITYVNEGISVFKISVLRSVRMQKQCVHLFPTLIGNFTSYSNNYFKAAMNETKERLTQEMLAQMNGDLHRYLPESVSEMIGKLKKERNLIAKPENLFRITAVEWYQLGAPLGFFNVYTLEYDAEGRAMWICCPEELVGMYRRANWVKWNIGGELQKEILNQATYISVRGINEVGDVLNYTD